MLAKKSSEPKTIPSRVNGAPISEISFARRHMSGRLNMPMALSINIMRLNFFFSFLSSRQLTICSANCSYNVTHTTHKIHSQYMTQLHVIKQQHDYGIH